MITYSGFQGIIWWLLVVRVGNRSALFSWRHAPGSDADRILDPWSDLLQTFLKSWLRRTLLRLVGRTDDSKHQMLRQAFAAVKSWGIQGHYLEFGVYRGRAMTEAFRLARRHGFEEMRFYAFDSFRGLPTPTADEGRKKFVEGQYACSLEEFRVNLRKNGVDLGRVTCIEGFYADSLTDESARALGDIRAAIVWIDCDLYQSTIQALNFVTPFLQPGSLLCFDDWFSFGGHPDKGEIRATREWLEASEHVSLQPYRQFGVSGLSFVVHVDQDSTRLEGESFQAPRNAHYGLDSKKS